MRVKALELIKHDASCIMGVPYMLRDHIFYLDAAKLNGSIIKYIPDEAKTKEVCSAAVISGSIKYNEIKNNEVKNNEVK